MIPLHKLEKLPRSQRLRKAAQIVREAERRIAIAGLLPPGESEYLGRMAELLAEEVRFSQAALKAAQTSLAVGSGADIRRTLNTFYQLLLSETGRYQADWDFTEPSGGLDPSKRRPFPGMQVYLEDIRSPFNVGSMFRAAESFGAEKVWLSPFCADPRHKRAERTAMGCVDILPWERFPHDPFTPPEGTNGDTAPFSEGLFFALETGGIPLGEFSFPSRGIIIAGSEELGVSPKALAVADASFGRVSIHTWGAKGSLNVSVAFGIVMQAWAAELAKHQFVEVNANV